MAERKPPDQGALFRLAEKLGFDEVLFRPEHPIPPERVGAVFGADARELVRLYPITLTDRVQQHLGEVIGSNAGVVREDLIVYLHSLVVRTKSQHELLSDFSGFISVEHYDALALSQAVYNLRELGLSEQAIHLKDSIYARYGRDGATIEHLYSTGYFHTLFDFQRRWLHYECSGNRENASRLFSEWFSRQLKFFPHAVYLDDQLAFPKDVVIEIMKRTNLKEKNVFVYSAGHRKNALSLEACRKFLHDNPAWGGKTKKYSYGGTAALQIELFLKKDRPGEPTYTLDYEDWRDVT